MIAIIDYKSGNLQSVANALDFIGAEYKITSNPDEISAADKAIFPGQGRAQQAMQSLEQLGLIETIKGYQKPFLGICIGMQLLLNHSEEDNIECLGIIPGQVKKFVSQNHTKIPQVGWNSVDWQQDSPITTFVPNSSYFYFVNSYYADVSAEYSVGTSHHGQKFSAVIQKDNFYGIQFHPEKSGTKGIQLLKNFSKI